MKTRNSAYFILSLALSALLLLLATNGANAAQLRQSAAVSANVVTLGDIFSNLNGAADTIVMRAPNPGKSLMLSTAKLRQMATTEGISWTPQFGDETLRIDRLSDIIGREEIYAALMETTARDGFGEAYEIELSSHIAPIHVAYGGAAAVEVISFDTDARRTRFRATIAAPANDPSARHLRVSGRIFRTELLPVVNRRIDSGETIRKADVAWRRLRISAIGNGTVSSMEELVGMNTRRPLQADAAVRRADLRTPILIAKGSSVKMVYRNRGLLLIALGRAVEDGAAGQEMRIMNMQSKSIVLAKAIGPDTVAVSQNGLIGIN
ncbi:MAG: flagellar basal body P-ring formation chaperone FlgA [Proteobacteria bacterium]|nr:flagellar basal body P-ring formation chaperone FlgA [Pseudomonadota bacterium]MDA1356124.1 flagellar basal body P-ring formation chaperone FlgA [Pseudomonadota bacterium]